MKKLELVDRTLLCKFNDVDNYRGGNRSKVVEKIGLLKEKDIQIIEAVLFDDCVGLWMWCRSSWGLEQLKFMTQNGELLRVISSLFKCFHKSVEPTILCAEGEQFERTTGETDFESRRILAGRVLEF